jgi:hypothetical protein
LWLSEGDNETSINAEALDHQVAVTQRGGGLTVRYNSTLVGCLMTVLLSLDMAKFCIKNVAGTDFKI